MKGEIEKQVKFSFMDGKYENYYQNSNLLNCRNAFVLYKSFINEHKLSNILRFFSRYIDVAFEGSIQR